MLVSHRALWRAQGAHREPGPLVLKRLFYSFPLPSTCHQEKCFSHDNEFLSSHKQLVWSEIKVKYRLKGNISAIFNFGRLHLSFSNLQNGIGALHPIQCISQSCARKQLGHCFVLTSLGHLFSSFDLFHVSFFEECIFCRAPICILWFKWNVCVCVFEVFHTRNLWEIRL